MAIGIYKITNKINNNFYIGQSVNIKRRFNEHKNRSKTQDSYLYRSIRKYGIDNFTFEPIAECERWELSILERLFIEKLKPHFNSDTVINDSYSRSEETKRKISKFNKGKKLSKETIEKIKSTRIKNDSYKVSEKQRKQISETLKRKYASGEIKGQLGFRHSKETKLKISILQKGKKQPQWLIDKRAKANTGKKRRPYNLKYKYKLSGLDKEFNNIKDISKFLNVAYSSVLRVQCGNRKTIKGHTIIKVQKGEGE